MDIFTNITTKCANSYVVGYRMTLLIEPRSLVISITIVTQITIIITTIITITITTIIAIIIL